MNIDDNTKIYRFLDFFEAHSILTKKKLRISKASTMDDKNELLGHCIPLLSNPLFKPKSSAELIEHHKYIKQNQYISSWTIAEDHIALWSIYSNTSSGVRISSTVKKLKTAINYFQESLPNPFNLPPNMSDDRMMVYALQHGVEPIKYVDFKQVFPRIYDHHKRINNIYKDINSLGIELGDEFYKEFSIRYNQICDSFRSEFPNTDFIKDACFDHEREIRLHLAVGLRNQRTKEELDSDVMHLPFSYDKSNSFPEQLFIDVPQDFIEEITPDPRMPYYRKQEIQEIISDGKLSVTESNSFGYYPEFEKIPEKINELK